MSKFWVLAVVFISSLLGHTPAEAAKAESPAIEAAREAMAAGDDAEAIAVLEPLAEQGDPTAQRLYGILVEEGRVPGTKPEQAVEWYRKAAQQDDLDAAYNLGLTYLEGEIVPVDDEAAFVHLWFAAEQGHAPAQEALAMMFTQGRGVEKDVKRADKLLERATASGYLPAATELGFRWLRRAHEKRAADTEFWPDLEQAYIYLSYALALNDRAATDDRLEPEVLAAVQDLLAKMNETIPDEGLQPARQLVRHWIANREQEKKQ